jgi:hypothetical protein
MGSKRVLAEVTNKALHNTKQPVKEFPEDQAQE